MFFFENARVSEPSETQPFFCFLSETQWRSDFKVVSVFRGVRRVFCSMLIFANADDLLRWMTKMFSAGGGFGGDVSFVLDGKER